MRLAELEEMMSERPDEAEAAIAELVSTADVGKLAHIATESRGSTLRSRAIDALGDVGGEEARVALVGILEAVNRPFLEGGTEQRLEHEGVRSRIVDSLARVRGVRPPAARTQRAIAEFIESSR